MRNNKGITLIALVITIIVLLILAGVSIAMLTGDNGILTQATNAKDETAKAEAIERMNMELNALRAAVLGSTTKSTFTAAEIQDVRDNLGDGYTVKPPTGDTATVTISTTLSTEVSDAVITINASTPGTVSVYTPAKDTTDSE